MATFFTADTHFGDPFILRQRGTHFSSIAEHDVELIARWNGVVKADDEVWHLGDFAVRASREYCRDVFSRLNGVKRLIRGNHDTNRVLNLLGPMRQWKAPGPRFRTKQAWSGGFSSLIMPIGRGRVSGDGVGPNPTDRGKWGTKRNILVDRGGLSLALTLTGANRHDSMAFIGRRRHLLVSPAPRTTPQKTG